MFLCFLFLNLGFYLILKYLIYVLTTVFFVFTNCIYATVKLVKCCLYVCYVQIKTSHLLTYFILPDIFTADYDAKQVALKCRCQGVSLVQSTL